MDDFTPREVWQEYEARKRAIDSVLMHQVGEMHRRRDLDVQAAADALGCGVPQHQLTERQRDAQQYAIARWRETAGCGG